MQNFGGQTKSIMLFSEVAYKDEDDEDDEAAFLGVNCGRWI